MGVTLSEALDTLGAYSWLLLGIVAMHAAVQVRKFQDAFPQPGSGTTAAVLSALRGLLATMWFGVGAALVQTAVLREPPDTMVLPLAACVLTYLAVTFFPGDLVFRASQVPVVNAMLLIGLEVVRALSVGVGVSSALKADSRNCVLAAALGALRGAWGWALGRPGAKVILGRAVSETSWPAPPVSTPASAVAAVLLVVVSTRADAEKVLAGLIAVLVAWRSYDLYQQS